MRRVLLVPMVPMVWMVRRVLMVPMVWTVRRVPMVWMVRRVPMVSMVRRVRMVSMVRRVRMVWMVRLVPMVSTVRRCAMVSTVRRGANGPIGLPVRVLLVPTGPTGATGPAGPIGPDWPDWPDRPRWCHGRCGYQWNQWNERNERNERNQRREWLRHCHISGGVDNQRHSRDEHGNLRRRQEGHGWRVHVEMPAMAFTCSPTPGNRERGQRQLDDSGREGRKHQRHVHRHGDLRLGALTDDQVQGSPRSVLPIAE